MSSENSPASQERDLKQFLKENASTIYGIDKRIFLTLKYLILRPGELTRDFIQGNFRLFTPPTTLYLSINLLFFLLLPVINNGGIKLLAYSYQRFTIPEGGFVKELILDDLQDSGLSEAIYEAQFDSFIKYNQPALIFIVIPFLILILRLVNLKKSKSLLAHTVYAFHFMSFYLLTFLMLGIFVNSIVPLLRFISMENIIPYMFTGPLLLYAIWLFYYLFKSLKVVFEGSILINLVKSALLFVSLIGILFLYTLFLVGLCILSVN